MIKTENASQVHELQDDELEKVSGGFDASKNEVAIETVVNAGAQKQVTRMEWGPVSFDIGLA
jgi:bacteriocin-like protein